MTRANKKEATFQMPKTPQDAYDAIQQDVNRMVRSYVADEARWAARTDVEKRSKAEDLVEIANEFYKEFFDTNDESAKAHGSFLLAAMIQRLGDLHG